MTFPSKYHVSVKRPVQRQISVPALLGIFVIPLLLVSLSSAQHESASSASSASSSSGHSFSASAPSAGSSGHTGYAPSHSSGVTFSTSHSHSPNGPTGNHHHHPNSGASSDVYYPYVYPVLIPYVADDSSTDANDNDDDDEYQGGPTIFDRRGSGADSYIPPTYEGPAHAHAADDASTENANSSFATEPPQPPTTLVFKDGHQLEIDNYAIVSQTLFDLTPGHPRRIALADLDLAATEKQNDDRGIIFQLPHPLQAN